MYIYTERERKESQRMLKREFSSDLKQLNTAMFYVKKKKNKNYRNVGQKHAHICSQV